MGLMNKMDMEVLDDAQEEAQMNRHNEPMEENLDEDTDSDLEDLQKDIAQLDESVRSFLASHRSTEDGESNSYPASRGSLTSTRGSTRGRGHRGPRKAAKPRGDITARISKVNQAFLNGDYPAALDLAFEIIRINAETHQAWVTVSSIFREQGEINKALSAMVYAAHLRPKDVYGWLLCADFALDNLDSDEAGNLETARLCYSAAIRADPKHKDSRLRKAAVCERQGHIATAIAEYRIVLKRHPFDLDTIRRLAEACIDNKNAESAVISAAAAYRRYIDFEIQSGTGIDAKERWHDVGIYVELLMSTHRYHEAIGELKRLGRWLCGRAHQTYWDDWQVDDREWDAEDERRLLVPEFSSEPQDISLYGQSFPFESRLRLAICRLKLGDMAEALRHMSWLGPSEADTSYMAHDCPSLLYDAAIELSNSSQHVLAIQYLKVLRSEIEEPDPTLLLVLGRCYLAIGENAAAEECFLSAIDADADNFEARIHLADMYEKVREDEEALILAAEAMVLRDGRQSADEEGEGSAAARPYGSFRFKHVHHVEPSKRKKSTAARKPTKPSVPRRYRPKRLAGNDQRARDEQAQALKLSQKYETVCSLRRGIKGGDMSLLSAWLESSQDLVDHFRSLKKFYTLEKYLRFLVPKTAIENPDRTEGPDTELSQMYQRLSSRTLAPRPDFPEGQLPSGSANSYESISYDDWLVLFLDYAVSLAMQHRNEDSYSVCEAARDSSAFQSSERRFIIHVAWSVCAILNNDEETCIRISRHLMGEAVMSDSCRMFALLSTICQSPVSWYTSGPAQKFILRQIKAIDAKNGAPVLGRDGEVIQVKSNLDGGVDLPGLDICLLMLYGHILFSSTSYGNASSYFLRAHSIDPDNAMVNLSLGLSYAHAGLKRQATNRSYLLLQGQSFMSRYVEIDQEFTGGRFRMETLFNVGRLYQMLGLSHLAYEYYEQALREDTGNESSKDIRTLIYSNNVISALMVRNKATALAWMKKGVKL